MDEIVVAKNPLGPAIVGAVGTAVLLSIVAIPFPFSLRVLILVVIVGLAILFVSRFAAMKLSVGRSAVFVVNFASSHELDLATVRIADETSSPSWPQNNVGDLEAGELGEPEKVEARVLCLTDASGNHVKVGVAPSYGNRLDVIAEDLYAAIATMRGQS